MTRRQVSTMLPPSLRVRLGLIGGLAALVVLALGVVYAGDGQPGRVDGRVWSALEGVGPLWRRVALTMDFLGDPAGSAMLIVAVVTGCLLLLRSPRAAVLVIAGVALTVGTTTLLKHVVGRTIHGDDNLAYPSGHTAFATALALVVALLATGRLGLGGTAGTSLVLGAALVAGAAMGWAQVVLGSHYPTDALGGWCTALVVIPATAWLVDRTADRLSERAADRLEDRMSDAGRRGGP
ncbi:phosphatase PAP2 family protein [Streptomyces sp. NPDC057696]|uniref:phosphatase PAP2 family protein n=1 Tax=Streptomyces sp. NPDC057696 TaxID=3346218 RepID=UPI0036A3B87A